VDSAPDTGTNAKSYTMLVDAENDGHFEQHSTISVADWLDGPYAFAPHWTSFDEF